MLKFLLYAALIQPITGISLKGVLPRRRLFQRKAKQTYTERKARRMAKFFNQDWDLNYAA